MLQTMPAITVRDVPDYVHRRLKRQAEAHNRSLNGEVLQLLEQAVAAGSSGERSRAVVEELKREQERTPAWTVSSEEMKRAMREGLS